MHTSLGLLVEEVAAHSAEELRVLDHDPVAALCENRDPGVRAPLGELDRSGDWAELIVLFPEDLDRA
jgi:hypothetical protein